MSAAWGGTRQVGAMPDRHETRPAHAQHVSSRDHSAQSRHPAMVQLHIHASTIIIIEGVEESLRPSCGTKHLACAGAGRLLALGNLDSLGGGLFRGGKGELLGCDR